MLLNHMTDKTLDKMKSIVSRINYITRSAMATGVSKRREYRKELDELRDLIIHFTTASTCLYNSAQCYDYKYNASCIRMIQEAEYIINKEELAKAVCEALEAKAL